MPLSIEQIGPCFAGEVSGIDLTRALSPQDAAAVHAGMDEYAVLVFRGQSFDDDQHLAFSRALGALEKTTGTSLERPQGMRLAPGLGDVSNLDVDAKPYERGNRHGLFNIGNHLWHSDSSFKTTPAKYSILHALSLPDTGGNTEFADMRAAYDALDEGTKAKLEGLVCEHSQLYSRGKIGFSDFSKAEAARNKPVRQILLRSHPVSGRKSLYLSSHAGAIVGWPRPEAAIFLMDLSEHATQRAFVYAHEWRLGDLVMWDNRQVMHRARDFPTEQPRDMRRTTLAGDGPTADQAPGAAVRD